MIKLIKIEKALFYFLVLTFFWQLRLVWLEAEGQFNEWSSIFLYATDIIIAAILFLWLLRLDRKVLAENIFNAVNAGLAAFLFFCVLSIISAQDKGVAIFRLLKLSEMVFLFFYVRYNFVKIYNFKRFCWWFIFGAVLQGLVALVQFFSQKSLGLAFFAESPLSASIDGVAKIVVGGEKIIRAYGLVPHPNILAAILIAAIFFLVWLFLEQKKTRLKSVLFLLVFLLLSVALFFTFSRGVIIVGGGLFLMWLAYLWQKSKDYHEQVISICVFLLAINCLLLVAYWSHISSRYNLVDLPGSQSVDLRVFYNQEALKMIWKEPLLGVGQGNFTIALRDNLSLPGWQYQPVHNIYLLAAAENGLMALLAFLAFLFLTVRSVWQFFSKAKTGFVEGGAKNLAVSCQLLIIVCLLLVGFFDHFVWDLQQGQILFWLILGLLSAHTRPLMPEHSDGERGSMDPA